MKTSDPNAHIKIDVFDLSDYIIKFYHKIEKPINNNRLNSVLYFIQAYFLMQIDEVCFIDDIIAREYGPVVPAVYTKYSQYGIDPIPLPKNPDHLLEATKSDAQLLFEVIDFTSEWSNSAMMSLIHDQRPYRHALNTHSRIIPPEKLKKYFG
ncbi:Uncharacterized phage-associated protein [Ruminococcus sp. YE71]|uniref:Panacea domain-containing protein n=1 Tax=unclassified Ruminococcus TaxID=2608920 RepID=UPI000888763A|nr:MULTISPECIES: type II toxin-antitoxin system antitoxin SocA domain-containing protein [unclassified Ruminococcus]SDA15922.1 Uncharacterized phage-associated protein [Ruminococcus sp. YE78]SFW23474.1 Uncharacterized phage-associated protein [Ruminococcus sp. YE71]